MKLQVGFSRVNITPQLGISISGYFVPRRAKGVLDELELTVPLFPEQQKIGAFLALLDDKIALNNKINDNLAA